MPFKRHREALLAVGHVIGDMADLAEGPHDVFGCVGIVFDDEKAHGIAGDMLIAG
jgi:hypothetical protein